jgi:signal transduction histidine kinase
MTNKHGPKLDQIDTSFPVRQIRRLITLPVVAFALSFVCILSVAIGRQWVEDSKIVKSEVEIILLSQLTLLTSEIFFEQKQAVAQRLELLGGQIQNRYPDWTTCIEIRKPNNDVISKNCPSDSLEKYLEFLKLPLKIGDETIAYCELRVQFLNREQWFLLKILLFSSALSTLFAAILIYFLGLKIDLKIVSPLLVKIHDVSRMLAMDEMAAQVAHDIRSPLSALNMISSTLEDMPEQKRILIRESIKRINDIANNLLEESKNRKTNSNNKPTMNAYKKGDLVLQPELLAPIIDSLVSEKRLQNRDRLGIEIESNLDNSYGLFAKIDVSEFKRVLSNLINNAIEALPSETGKVSLNLMSKEHKVQIVLRDNGKGIPHDVLVNLGKRGVTHGKEGTAAGSGLGVYHAKLITESFGADFKIESRINQGTTITITFPSVDTPKWFVSSLRLSSGVNIVSLDDDLTIHKIWQERLDFYRAKDLSIQHFQFSTGNDLAAWLCRQTATKRFLFLVDYELIGQSETGLDVIQRLQIQHKAILVTSRYEELQIRSTCEKLNVKLIPKAMAGFVPIVFEQSEMEDF